jgi:hypothetical protein
MISPIAYGFGSAYALSAKNITVQYPYLKFVVVLEGFID